MVTIHRRLTPSDLGRSPPENGRSLKPGPHRTCQRCSGPVCDRPSASQPVQNRPSSAAGGVFLHLHCICSASPSEEALATLLASCRARGLRSHEAPQGIEASAAAGRRPFQIWCRRRPTAARLAFRSAPEMGGVRPVRIALVLYEVTSGSGL